jgi:hypothetical protein
MHLRDAVEKPTPEEPRERDPPPFTVLRTVGETMSTRGVTAHLEARRFTLREGLPSIVWQGEVRQADLLFTRRVAP